MYLGIGGIMRKLGTLALISLFFVLTGCGAYMAAKQPDKKDIDLFRIGTPRAMLLAEFGLPIVSEERDGRKYEIFKFVQGYSGGAKTGRAVFHGAADIVTLGLWEIVATPTESAFSGNEMAFRVRYDKDDLIDEVAALKQ
jgi:hypothetical protein